MQIINNFPFISLLSSGHPDPNFQNRIPAAHRRHHRAGNHGTVSCFFFARTPGERRSQPFMPPCPHFDLRIVQRSKRQSAVASAAYQSGERLFSEYDQKQKYYSHKSEIVHTEIMLPPHAPPEYADRNTLWNAAEAIEKQWNSQLGRRLVLAIPRDIPPAQQADLCLLYTSRCV